MSLLIGLEGGEPHDVRLTRSGGNAVVWIDGVSCAVTSAPTGQAVVLEIEGRRETIFWVSDRDTVFLHAFGRSWKLHITDTSEATRDSRAHADVAVAPMPGVVVSIAVQPGEAVTRNQVLAVIESMKMHSEITAPRDGHVDRVLVSVRETFEQNAPLVTLVPLEPAEESA